MNVPPCSLFYGFSGLDFASKPVPPSCPEPSLLHTQQNSARLDH